MKSPDKRTMHVALQCLKMQHAITGVDGAYMLETCLSCVTAAGDLQAWCWPVDRHASSLCCCCRYICDLDYKRLTAWPGIDN